MSRAKRLEDRIDNTSRPRGRWVALALAGLALGGVVVFVIQGDGAPRFGTGNVEQAQPAAQSAGEVALEQGVAPAGASDAAAALPVEGPPEVEPLDGVESVRMAGNADAGPTSGIGANSDVSLAPCVERIGVSLASMHDELNASGTGELSNRNARINLLIQSAFDCPSVNLSIEGSLELLDHDFTALELEWIESLGDFSLRIVQEEVQESFGGSIMLRRNSDGSETEILLLAMR